LILREDRCVDSGADLQTETAYWLQPNCSMSWRGLQFVVGVLWLFSAVVVYWAWNLGAWMVMPFSGLEMLLVTAAFYYCAVRARTCEEVALDAQQIRVRRGARELKSEAFMPRHWAQVELRKDPRRWYPTRLLLRSHGRAIEIARNLMDEERALLARDLRHTLEQDPASLAEQVQHEMQPRMIAVAKPVI
jgi:uncharacterized membrane protein